MSFYSENSDTLAGGEKKSELAETDRVNTRNVFGGISAFKFLCHRYCFSLAVALQVYSFYNYVIEQHFMHLKANEITRPPPQHAPLPHPTPPLFYPRLGTTVIEHLCMWILFWKTNSLQMPKTHTSSLTQKKKTPETSADASVQDFLNSLKPVSPLMEEEKTMYSLSTDLFC